MARGVFPRLSREGALLSKLSSSWRAATTSNPGCLTLFAGTNEYACSEKDTLKTVARHWCGGERAFAVDMLDWAMSGVDCPDGCLPIVSAAGGFMGHVFAPALFCYNYNECIGSWNLKVGDSLLQVRDPVSLRLCDISLAVFVTDVAKFLIQGRHDHHVALPRGTTQVGLALERSLGSGSCGVSEGKSVHLGPRSRGAAEHTRDAMNGRLVRRMLAIGVLQNNLLAGVAAFPLQAMHYRAI